MAYDSHDHGVYTRRYFCASKSSVSEHITLDSNLRPMIMNYHEIITEFASCRVGFRGIASKSFYYNAILDWNALPSHIQTIRSKLEFKKAVKKHLAEVALRQESAEFVRV